MKHLLIACALLTGSIGAAWAQQAPACPALLNHTFPRLQDEKPQSLCQYSGKVLLIVNTASYCGFTPQYKGLEELHARYTDLGLVVLGAFTRDGFKTMVEYTSPVFWFFMILVGISLFIFRRREPDRILGYRVPLYPVTPIIFVLTCIYLLYSSLEYTGIGALVGVGVLVAGTPLLLLSRKTAAAE